METFDFFPFVTPTNAGTIVFPNIDTRVESTAPAPTPTASPMPSPAADPVDTLSESMQEMKIQSPSGIDLEKVKRSSRKAGKNSDVYSLGELKGVAKAMGVSFKGNISKKDLIALILKENRVF